MALCVTLPIGLAAGYFRVKYEIQFEQMNAEVFAESSKFAAESISAFRTVCSFSLEDQICARYDKLLNNHVHKAFKKARWSTLIFAFADSTVPNGRGNRTGWFFATEELTIESGR